MPAIKAALRSPQARADIENAIDHYLVQAPHMVGSFIDALEKATTHIQRAPGTGSPRYAHELDMPGLRFWLLSQFPYGLFFWNMKIIYWSFAWFICTVIFRPGYRDELAPTKPEEWFQPRNGSWTLPSGPSWGGLARRDDVVGYCPQGEATRPARPRAAQSGA